MGNIIVACFLLTHSVENKSIAYAVQNRQDAQLPITITTNNNTSSHVVQRITKKCLNWKSENAQYEI